MTYPEDIECNCSDSFVTVTKNEHGWAAKCEGCGRFSNPCSSYHVLYAEWYGLAPVKEISGEIAATLTPIIKCLAEVDGEIDSRELVKLGEKQKAARAVVAILCDSGLLSARFVMDDASGEQVELSIEEALKAKRADKESVRTLCRKTFSLDA